MVNTTDVYVDGGTWNIASKEKWMENSWELAKKGHIIDVNQGILVQM